MKFNFIAIKYNVIVILFLQYLQFLLPITDEDVIFVAMIEGIGFSLKS